MHGRRIIDDLLQSPWIDGTSVVLMAPHLERLRMFQSYAQRVVEKLKRRVEIEVQTTFKGAIHGADAIVLMYDAGGFDAFKRDFETSRRFGVDLCIGDSSGPTGVMKIVRNVAVLKEISQVIHNENPETIVINYVNPMGPMTIAADAFGIKRYVGLCGGVRATQRRIAQCLAIDESEIDTLFAGINHMTWALKIEQDGVDLYPRLRESMSSPTWIAADPIRFEVLQHFGYFVTETSGHLSDFFPWFRNSERSRRRYCYGSGYAGASGAFYRYSSYLHDRLGDVDFLSIEPGTPLQPSGDELIAVLDALLNDRETTIYANTMNRSGSITNLPSDVAIEVPVTFRNGTINPTYIGELPAVLSSLCRSNTAVHQIGVSGAIERSPNAILSALSIDPLTAATLDLSEIRSMASELIRNNKEYFPSVDTKKLFLFPDVKSGKDATPEPTSGDSLLQPVQRYDALRRLNGWEGSPSHDE